MWLVLTNSLRHCDDFRLRWSPGVPRRIPIESGLHGARQPAVEGHSAACENHWLALPVDIGLREPQYVAGFE